MATTKRQYDNTILSVLFLFSPLSIYLSLSIIGNENYQMIDQLEQNLAETKTKKKKKTKEKEKEKKR